ncbi:hypothetical protein [Devosia sp. 1635]|uniref:hypothetical protein n=1 Tax=Devosia sp. 1635 TaxID=2726066 RepID=UPI001565215F|nr:hypothetical protein [Devosia sp. 1635]
MAKIKIDVEDLVVWALAKQHADVSRGSGIAQELRQLAGGATATDRLEAYLAVGSRIDGGGSSSHKVSPDAQRVAAVIDAMPIEAAALVVLAGRNMAPIEWGEEGIGRWVPVYDRKGRHKKRWQDPAQCRGLLGWEYEYEGYMPSGLDLVRLQYVVWWEALRDLQQRLSGRLQGFEATGPRRSAEPWNDKAPVIHYINVESLDVM